MGGDIIYRKRSGQIKNSYCEDALSEIVSSLSLIVVLVIATGIILSFSTGQYPKPTIPHTELSSDLLSSYPTFYHKGGENLTLNDIRIDVYDNGTKIKNYTSADLSVISPEGTDLGPGATSDFGYGYALKIKESVPGENVSFKLILNQSGGQYLYREFGKKGTGVGAVPTTPTPTPTPDMTCTLTEADAIFAITQSGSNPPTYLLSSSGIGVHSYTIVGPGFSKTINGKEGTIVLPNLTSDRTYQVIHNVIQFDNNYPVCSRSSSDSLAVQGCSDSCYANFIYDTDPSNRLNISFQDRSEGADEWQWNFGDGHTSSISNPFNLYTTPSVSSYKVTLTIGKNQCGNRIYCSTTKQVFINCSGNADFSWVYDSTSRKPWNTTFTWNAGTYLFGKPYVLVWDFGDGNRQTKSSDDWTGSILHSYTQCNDYSATLTVNTKDCGSYSGTKTVSLPCICYDNPIANFSVAKEQIGTPFVISITDGTTHSKPSTGLVQWIWDMGDGVVFNNTSPPGTFTYSYPRCGEYSILLTVFDSQGCWDDTIRKISCGGDSCVPGIPDASFTYTLNGRTVQCTDTSTPAGTINRWQWDMGDGTRYSSQNVAHEYATYGNYTVKLRVWDQDGCFGDMIRDVSLICPEPAADFIIMNHPEDPSTFTFSDNSTIPTGLTGTYLWDFGDGNTSTIRNPPDKTYSVCRSYPVRLKVTTNCGSWNETIKAAVCNCTPPEARFRIDPTTDPQEFHFINESLSSNPITSIFWEFGDGSSSTEENPTYRYATCGQFTVRLKITTDCGSSDDVIRDAICGCPPPTPDFAYSCIGSETVRFTDLSRTVGGGITAWNWEFGDGESSVLQNPQHTYARSGTWPVNLSVTTSCGSSARWTRFVTVPCCEMPVPGFTYACNPDGLTVDFSDTTKTSGDDISDWLWEFGDGSSSILQNPQHTYTGNGTWPVNLSVTTTCGAKNTYQESITTPCFCTPPVANFSTEIISGEPFTVRIRDSSQKPETITHWNWSFGDGTYYTGQNPPDHTFAAGCGEYLISLTVTNECGARDTFDKLVCCPVYANFTYRMEPVNGTAPLTVYFTDRTIGTPQSWGWTFGDGGVSSFRNPVYTYKTGGNYSATLHATSPCGGNETHSEQINVYCPPVEALFNYTIVNEDPLTVQFTDLSTGYDIVEWNWYFGDGSFSKEQHPVHTYYIRDDYQVILTIKNSCGSESTNSLYLPIGCLPLTIVATAHEGGFINPSGNVTVPCEWSQQFNITPDLCHTIRDVVIDENQPNAQHLGPVESYTFINVQYDQTIDAYFDLKQFQIASSGDVGGTIDPLGITVVDCGSDQSYNITAGFCYNITDVIINGTEHLGPQVSPFTYIFTNVTSDQSIHAMFALKTFPINATAGEGGSISPSGIMYVPCGYDQTYTITSSECYNITSILVDGSPLTGPFTSPYTYTFTNVQESHLINAEFTVKNYTITATAGANGQISPSGAVSVTCGSNQAFVITANPCYNISSIIIDGSPLSGPFTSPHTYTFTNVQQSHTINAEFAIKNFTITATAGSNGQISPAGTVTVNCGSDQIYLITANPCYDISSIIIDGSPIPGPFTSPYTYTFTNVQQSHTINAEFAIKNFIITATAGPNGQISPSGAVGVNCGSNQAFTITANSGYIIIDVVVNGVSMGAVSSYTFTNVQSDQTIHAIFDDARNWCTISGYVRTSSGVGVPGIRINVWNDDRTILERTGVSQADGFYTIMHERPPNNYWVDLNCPDTPTWDTTNPADGWINRVQLNPGGKCSAENQNFIGRIIP